jgi:hypothetical protein
MFYFIIHVGISCSSLFSYEFLSVITKLTFCAQISKSLSKFFPFAYSHLLYLGTIWVCSRKNLMSAFPNPVTVFNVMITLRDFKVKKHEYKEL